MRPRYLAAGVVLLVLAAFAVWLHSARRPAPPPWAYGGCDLANTRYYPRPSPVPLAKLEYQMIWAGGIFNVFPFIEARENASVLIADLTGDRYPELIAPPFAPVLNQNGTLKGHLLEDPKAAVRGIADWRRDGTFETIVEAPEGRQTFIRDSQGNVLANLPMLTSAVLSVCLKPGTTEDWIVSQGLSSGWASPYRGNRVACFDSGGRLLWESLSGARISLEAIADLDGDGSLEVVYGTQSEEHGAKAGGRMDQAHGYLVALDSDGKEMWSVSFSGWVAVLRDSMLSGEERVRTRRQRLNVPGKGTFLWMRAAAADLDGDGEVEVVGYGGSWEKDWGKIVILRGKDGHVVGEFPRGGGYPHSFYTLGIADLDLDGKKEIVSGSSDGYVWIFDSMGRVVTKYSVPTSSVRWDNAITDVWAINDIDGDSYPEVLVSSTSEQIIADDPRYYPSEFSDQHLLILGFDPIHKTLNEKLRIPLGERCRAAVIADLIPGGPNEIVALTDEIEVYSLTR